MAGISNLIQNLINLIGLSMNRPAKNYINLNGGLSAGSCMNEMPTTEESETI
jgi:hypothetical protein